MSSYLVTFTGVLLLSTTLVLGQPMKSPRKCTRIKNPMEAYPANQTLYFDSLIKCVFYCENSTTALNFVSYKNQVCKLYAKYPGFTDSQNRIYCFASPIQRRYCLVSQSLPFSQAILFCQRFYMNLLSLETAVENEWFFAFLKKLACSPPNSCNNVVLVSGASTTGAPGTWMWEGSKTTIELNPWMPGYPSLGTKPVALLLKIEGNITTSQSWWLHQDQLIGTTFFCEFDDMWT